MKIIANNKKAKYDYDISLKINSGLVLTGSEVKSLRNNSSSIKEAYVQEKKGELWLCNCYIKRYNSSSDKFDIGRAGTGNSNLPDLKEEFNSLPHDRGTLSMARTSDPNSANSQFFICFKPAPFLDRQYTVFGKVLEGMEFVDKIKRGEPAADPDKIISFKSQ